MRWTVVVPGALLPAPIAADVLAGATTPWLLRMVARARVEPATTFDSPGAAHLHWLWRQFGGAGDPVTAPYALRAVGGEIADQAQCWHIDPVHFAFARDHLLVAPLADAPPTVEETALLAQELREALADAAAKFEPQLHVHGEHWLLTLARPWSVRATLLDGAFGQSAHEHWPAGTDAAIWRKLSNEVQMRWHQTPLNDVREAQGQRTINALWLHGGGTWRRLPASPFAAVASRDPVLRGWALAAGLTADALHEDDAVPPARGDALSIRRDLLLPAQFESWGQWLLHLADLETALQNLCNASFGAGYDEIALALAGRRQLRIVRLRRGDHWRLWRKSAPAEVFAETEATKPS